jgi:hypothetical protein
MSAPRQACDLVNGGSVPRSGGGCSELFGEHSFSVRDQVPPKGARDFRQSSAAAKNGSCIGSRFRGYEGCHTTSFPRLAGTPARLHWRVLCFLGFDSSIGARRASLPG